jgi:signal transduction histidine kinase
MNAELDSYAHTVAHNLKNPLSNIMGFSQILIGSVEELPPEELDQYLGYISDSAVKIKEIIDGLLQLARIRREEVVFEPIEMDMVVDEALSTLSTLMDEYKPEISMPSTWPASWGNNNWVEQIWLNYLSNGLKYGGQPPKLELGADLLPDGMVRFWVADNGAGLSQEQQAKLFRPFTRLSVSAAKGHGLGLSIVQNMVMKLGGQVGIESQPEQGSLFYFTLPGSLP